MNRAAKILKKYSTGECIERLVQHEAKPLCYFSLKTIQDTAKHFFHTHKHRQALPTCWQWSQNVYIRNQIVFLPPPDKQSGT